MSNKNEDIGKVFRDVVEGFDEDLPTRVWDNVNNELKKDKQRKKVIVYFSIAASVALIIAFSSGYFMALNNSKHPYYSKINKELNTKPLTNASDNKKDLKNNNNPEINILQKNNHKSLKSNNLPPIKPVLNTTLSYYMQNNKEVKQDTNSVKNDSVSRTHPDFIAKNNIKKLTNDSANTIKPKINIFNDFKKDIDNQAAMLNKNQNNINNNIPKEKLKETENTSGKWSLAEQFSPVGYMGNTQKTAMADMSSNNYSGINQSNYETVKEKKILLVYATGMSFKYQLNRKWGVKSGVFYATGELGSGQQHKQLEVPVMASYELINKKFIWELNGGFGTNLLFYLGEKNINYSGLLGTTIGYNISKKISLNIEPTIKYNFSYPSNYIFHYYPFSVAVYTGLSYKF